LTLYPTLPLRDRPDQQKEIRASGHALSILAENFSRRERAVLAQAVNVAGKTLLAVFVTVLLLGVGSALFLVRQVVRPLRELELQLDELAEGHEQQLTLPSKDQEIQSFVHHFNTMLNRLRVQQNQLRHHEKAAALGVLVSGVAHELNNPLSNISTSVQLLVEDGDSVVPELRREWMAQIDGEAERARRIVRRLLDSVRQPKLNLQAHSVAALIQASLALVIDNCPPGWRCAWAMRASARCGRIATGCIRYSSTCSKTPPMRGRSTS
jgi:signal transduction histidine kinase